ncbi:chorismate-binding protein [Halobacteriovorax sp. HLS]|uniref:chorismate-binding protein n=1 Tax=Halobacteriovorax sp. HLS TaxID=2234000 RepID=UPI000FD8CABC|nr:chorismate-binding protein [Halobacteriovorax sp. HLS]
MWSTFWDGEKFTRYSKPLKAKAYYLNHYIDLLTGASHPFKFDQFKEYLETIKLQTTEFEAKRIFHLFYEAGYEFNDLEFSSDDTLLVLELEYERQDKWTPITSSTEISLRPLKGVHKRKYKEDFKKVQRHLKNGDCYQVNLTYDFEFAINEDYSADDICSKLWAKRENISPYAHATFVEELDLLLLSNSPECLFNSRVESTEPVIWSMPIKGTLPRTENWKRDWEKLLSSNKDQAELNMITDLLRNDLTRIELSASRVVKKNEPLLVPKIIHQYSLITTRLSQDANLLKVVRAMFPGGSITGAPKLKVMQIIKDIEKRNRGAYCGSTILMANRMCNSSINIRTAVVDLKNRKLNYSAGGGITLLSNCEDEFLEMHLKKDSFIKILIS